ncbi:MAG: hypothetical protein ACLR8Y_15480 [Alistipes indistinctus]
MAAVKTQIRAKTEEVRQATKEVKTITTLNKAEEGSLVALRAQYLLMAAAYDRMSKEERESAHGTLLLKAPQRTQRRNGQCGIGNRPSTVAMSVTMPAGSVL